jgi:hypothetical protein
MTINYKFLFVTWVLLNSASLLAAVSTVGTNFISSGDIDLQSDSLTLPLHQGFLKDGRKVWFILTDTDDQQKAQEFGLAYSPRLSNAANAKSTRTATRDSHGTFTFDSGTVDFKPVRNIVPGGAPNFFPPRQATPGSVGDANYTPFVRVTNEGNVIYNAPIIAFDVDEKQINFCEGNVDHALVHDKVVRICPAQNQVTVALSHGYAENQSLVYISLDANVELAATMEASTYVPSFNDLKSQRVARTIYAVANGEIGKANPNRQGFDSALNGDGSPLNILDGLPAVSGGYSPLWDLNLGVWTESAIQSGVRKLVTGATELLQAVDQGAVTGPGGMVFGTTGILINCPVVATLK